MDNEKSVNVGTLAKDVAKAAGNNKDNYVVAEIRSILNEHYFNYEACSKEFFINEIAKDISKFINDKDYLKLSEELSGCKNAYEMQKTITRDALEKAKKELEAIKANEAKREEQIAKLEERLRFNESDTQRIIRKYNDLKTDNELKTKILNKIFR